MLAQGYVCETSPLGNVYYLPDGVTVTGDISINYMEYPWITCFEVSGLAVSQLSYLPIAFFYLFIQLSYLLITFFYLFIPLSYLFIQLS